MKRAVCAGLGGETALVRLDGASRMYEFSRFTGECVDAEYKGKLRIAPTELYRTNGQARIEACSHRTCKTEHTAPRLNRYGECLCVEVAQ